MEKNNKIWIIIAIIIIIAMGIGGKKEAVIPPYVDPGSSVSVMGELRVKSDATSWVPGPPAKVHWWICRDANCMDIVKSGYEALTSSEISDLNARLTSQFKTTIYYMNFIAPTTEGYYYYQAVAETSSNMRILQIDIDGFINFANSNRFYVVAGAGCSDYTDEEIIDISHGVIRVTVQHDLDSTTCQERSTNDIGFQVICDPGYEKNVNGRQSTCTAIATPTCTDTDTTNTYPDGKNYFTRGSITYDTGGALGSATVHDICLNDGITLIEQTCLNGIPNEIQKNCKDFGSDWSCESLQLKGACVKNIVASYTYQCTGADGEIGYTASTGGGLIDIGNCSLGKECASLFEDSNTILSLEAARNLICKTKACIEDNSCAANICPDKTCVNNCGRTISGTKDCGTPPPPPITCTKNSDCPAGKECNSKGRCVSECLPLLQKWDEEEGECGTSSIVIIIGIFIAIMIALKMMPKSS